MHPEDGKGDAVLLAPPIVLNGMGGAGKTVAVAALARNQRVRRCFEQIVYVAVGLQRPGLGRGVSIASASAELARARVAAWTRDGAMMCACRCVRDHVLLVLCLCMVQAKTR